MKTISFNKQVIFGLSILFLISCTSHEQNNEDAFDKYKKDKNTISDSIQIYKGMMQELKQEEIRKRNEITDDWSKYKNETEKRISHIDLKIKLLKEVSISNSKITRRISSLEKSNNEIKKQMKEYNEDMKLRLSKFKTTIDKNINEIDNEINDIKSDNEVKK